MYSPQSAYVLTCIVYLLYIIPVIYHTSYILIQLYTYTAIYMMSVCMVHWPNADHVYDKRPVMYNIPDQAGLFLLSLGQVNLWHAVCNIYN